MVLRTAAAAAFVVLVSAGCESEFLKEPPKDRGTLLSGSEIKAGLVGNTVVAEWTSKGPLTVYFPAYGEMRGLRSFHYRDNGTWRVTEDGFCGEWNNWLGTMAQCWRAHRSGDAVNLEKFDGPQRETFKLVPGNPANL
jgi:hypothetical protein